ncbi:MAG: hypothetical protein ACRDHG_08710 [Anaerolineales bacterium]
MAVMGETDRVATWSKWMQDNLIACAITKPQLRAAIDAADDWADSNAASFNNALPTAAKNNLTAKQKAFLLALVILRRHDLA